MRSRRSTRLAVVLSLVGVACGGKPIGPGGAAGTSGGVDGGVDAGRDAGPKVVGDPGFVGMRLLTRREYDNTVRDLLGVEGKARERFQVEARYGEFESNSANVIVRPAAYEAYLDEAERLSAAVFADPALRARVVACPRAESTAGECVRAMVPTLAQRAWRRPLTDDEAVALATLADAAAAAGGTRDGAIQRALTALLSSAPFLFRLELDPSPTSIAAHALTPWELATRLSYTLWATLPDERLFSLAADGSLARDDVFTREVNRLLADERADALIDGFARPWLDGSNPVEAHQVEPAAFPTWNQELAAAMAGELRLYVREFLRSERSFASFLDADFNFVNEALARHYGMPTNGLGTELSRVEVTTDRRRGFLGLGAFLATTSFSYRTSIPLRGKRILSGLLCVEIPLPPATVPKLEDLNEPTFNSTPRESYLRVEMNPECGACHKVFDGYGFALEELDAIGRFRARYADGQLVDARGSLPDGTSFTGEAELASVLARDPRFVACAARKALTYALGRPLRVTDEQPLLRLGEDWAREGTTLRALFRRVALDDAFRNRRGEERP